MDQNIGKIQPVEVTTVMQKNFLDYAMSVIVARALPDVRDGLKPVHRRILYAMHDIGMHFSGKHKKSATIVGEVIGKYHPHGDMPIYDALVRLAQEFSMRYPLIDGQGNFGSIDGDSPAAMRYCITGDSLVITNQGLERIKDIKDRKGVKILSWNNSEKNAPKWFDSGIHPTIKIETYRGFSLRGSLNHPVLTWTLNKNGQPSLSWKLLGGVTEGEYAVINRTDTFFPEDPLLAKYYPQTTNPRTEKHTLPKSMTPQLAFMLGSLIAEGNVSKEQIGFCNNDKEYLDKFKSAFNSVFPDCRLHEFLRKPEGFTKKSYYSLEIHSTQVIEFLKNLGLNPAHAAQKEVPEIIYSSSKKSLAAFLSGYAEGDGSVYRSGAPEISFISKSKALLSQLQIILLRYGLESSVRLQPSKDIYKLLIRGYGNLNAFATKINFVSKRKRDKLSEVAKLNSDEWIMSKTDFIPFVSDYLRNSPKYSDHKEWLTKHNFDRLPKLKKLWPELQQILDTNDKKIFEQILANEFLFDKITKVENSTPERVYSIGVDSSDHSFISNGFISHNTEARLSKIAEEMLVDIEKETVVMTPNFDSTRDEPSFLPAKLPNLLLMGCEGIAVGMATKIPPHNLSEIVDAIVYLVDHPEASIEDLMQFIKGPDFPTAGSIYDTKAIAEVYSTGRGRIVVRGKAEIEEGKSGKTQIVITELPYQVNKAEMVAHIADLHHEKKIDGLSDLRDESDRDGIRVVIELKRDAKPKSLLNNLYKHTTLQTTFPCNFVALVDGTPQTLNLKQILSEYIKHRQIVITKRSEYELKIARARAHILEGLKIALGHLDAVIKTIRESKDSDDAKKNLMDRFGLSELQAVAILDMQLRRLAALERQKIEDEYKQVKEYITFLEDLLAHPEKILEVIKTECLGLKEKFSDPRRTRVYKNAIGEFSEEDLIPAEEIVVTVTGTGYIKRQNPSVFRAQHRGGKGVTGMTTKDEDEIVQILSANTHDDIYFFTDKGRVFRIKTYDLPEGSRQAKGQAIVNLINIEQGEQLQAILPLGKTHEFKFLLMATQKGTVKKTKLAEFDSIRQSGKIAIKLEQGDSLKWVNPTTGSDHILLVSHTGKSIRFKEEDVRSTARDTMGVRGIDLKASDFVVGMEVFPSTKSAPTDKRRKTFEHVLIVMEKGLGKRTGVKEWPLQKRGGQGVKAAEVTPKTGQIVSCVSVDESVDQIILTSKSAQIIKLPLKNIPQLGRATQGVILMRFAKSGDSVASVTCLEKEVENSS